MTSSSNNTYVKYFGISNISVVTPISQQPLNLDRQYDDQLPLRMPNAGNLLTVSQRQC